MAVKSHFWRVLVLVFCATGLLGLMLVAHLRTSRIGSSDVSAAVPRHISTGRPVDPAIAPPSTISKSQ